MRRIGNVYAFAPKKREPLPQGLPGRRSDQRGRALIVRHLGRMPRVLARLIAEYWDEWEPLRDFERRVGATVHCPISDNYARFVTARNVWLVRKVQGGYVKSAYEPGCAQFIPDEARVYLRPHRPLSKKAQRRAEKRGHALVPVVGGGHAFVPIVGRPYTALWL